MFHSPAERTFRHNFGLRFALALTLIGVLGVSGFLWNDDSKLNFILEGIVAFSVLMAAAAWILLSKIMVAFHPEGISYSSAFGETDILWPEVQATLYNQSSHQAIHFGLIGALVLIFSRRSGTGSVSSKSLKIIARDAKSINLSSNLRDCEEAIRMALRKINPAILVAARGQLRNGQSIEFGPLTLTQERVSWKEKKPIALSSLVKCKMDGQYLRIKAEGKWLDNIVVGIRKVPNVFVFLDLVDELRAGGRKPEPDPLRAVDASFGV